MLRKAAPLALLASVLLALAGALWRTKRRGPAIAHAHQHYLYQSDLAHLAATASNPQDKAALEAQYIQHWLLQQLLLAAAERHSAYDKAAIAQKVQAYRQDLLVQDFLARQVEQQLDHTVSEEALASYYQAHQQYFVLLQSKI